ncbi:hypothetical protein HTZ77_26145 [Nonomuraea sp. SMC257]|uniref:CBM2 domain-containing protein n=1 Tax=Nonomuraea montanisoli TaxID=2741721 RepID=A0A7Y6IB51_9ACTN|nr:hypothetical protein [Nonomuraea montanisoli]NUW34886.1 hypothetical protein [Nonomuraea montanisoli]
MGRHTGGADDASERGNGTSDDSHDEDFGLADRAAQWAAAPDPTSRSSFWDSDDERAEQPGWPELPDQAGVTGQWAPMPQRDPGAAVRPPEKSPFETTGAFQPPPSRARAGSGPAVEQPFETTGAFARPPHWDEPGQGGEIGDSTQTFGMPQDFGGDGPAGPNAFGASGPRPAGGDGPSGPHAFGGESPSGPPVSGGDGPSGTRVFSGRGAPIRRAFEDGRPSSTPGFVSDDPYGGDRPSGPQGFGDDGPSGPHAFGSAETHVFGERPQAFGPAEPQAFGDGPQGRGGDATQMFGLDGAAAEQTRAQSPEAPPEPGDIKVFGTPTMVDAQAPAWAEGADNGFLGSGWSGGDEPGGDRDGGSDDDPAPRRRGRRKPPSDDADPYADPPARNRGRLALLSVAAVAVVLGGTVAGVKLMSGSSQPSGCPADGCAAVQATNQPGPQGSQPATEETEEPTEEESGEASPTDEPTAEKTQTAGTPGPQTTTNVRAPRRSATPEPKPSKTKKAAKPTQEPLPTPTEETALETPSEEPSTITVTQPADNATGNPVPTATETTGPSGGGSVSVGFDVVRQRLTGYTAHLDVVNSSPQAIKSLTVSVPVKGRVLNLTGAEYTQDGDLLIIDLPDTLAEGDSTEITFTATGRAAEPENCGLVGGDCAVG